MRSAGNVAAELVVLAALWLLYDPYSAVAIIGMFQMFLAFVTPVLFTLLVFLKPSNDYIKLVTCR
ncbi:hypothetical protein ACWEV3_09425 [Saccharopolyspora sp. NPDC003752]